MEKIMKVSSVKLQIWKSKPPMLEIDCQGVVTTTGWTNGQLAPYYYIMPPQDGIYEFDFVADPPKEMALQVLTPISARFVWPSFPEDLKGVRIYSKTNDIVAKLSRETNEISLDVKRMGTTEEQPTETANHIGMVELENKSLVFNAVLLSHQTETLFLNGLVLTYHEDDVISIERAVPQGINPAILIFNLKVTHGKGPIKGTLKPFTFQEAITTNYQQVSINFKNECVTVDVQTIHFPEFILDVIETKKHEKEADLVSH
jgi:hypothetical protein